MQPQEFGMLRAGAVCLPLVPATAEVFHGGTLSWWVATEIFRNTSSRAKPQTTNRRGRTITAAPRAMADREVLVLLSKGDETLRRLFKPLNVILVRMRRWSRHLS